jgi:Ca2+-binding EF-hand superfamily protein
MINLRKVLVAAVSVCSAVGLAAIPAARANDKGEHAGGAGHEFQMMDADHDGKVSADEHAAGAKKMFEMMDADKDGKVTAAEMDAAHQQVTGAKMHKSDMSAADKIKKVDTNGDGTVTAEEHSAAAKAMFDKMDTNKDGFLSKAELTAGHSKMMQKGGSNQKTEKGPAKDETKE